jgi:GDP-L-fucose synthase
MFKKTILIFGGSGLAGNAIKDIFAKNFIVHSPSRDECNLLDYKQVIYCIETVKPDLVINCAGLVGGILFNMQESCESLIQNMNIGLNVSQGCIECNVSDYIYLGSNCIYPNNISHKIGENDLLSSKLEPTNRSYALAKISTIQYISAINLKYKKNYFAVMPPNLYGINDTFNVNKSHVLQSLIMKIDNAKINNKKIIDIWGDGTPRREFLNTTDLAEGIYFLYKEKDKLFDIIKSNEFPIINIGTGIDYKISDIALMVAKEIDWDISINYDTTKPKGTISKLLDITKINSLGWKSNINLEDGIKSLYTVYKNGNYRTI